MLMYFRTGAASAPSVPNPTATPARKMPAADNVARFVMVFITPFLQVLCRASFIPRSDTLSRQEACHGRVCQLAGMDTSSAIELLMSIVPTCRDSMSCHGTVLDSRRQDLKMSRVLRLAALSALVLALPIVIVAQGAKGTSGAHPPGGVARAAMPAAERPFGTLREQAAMQQKWLKKRLDTFLPALMRKHGIDLWVVPMREYNEDPVFSAITAPETFFARRRTIYVFFDNCAASVAPVTAGW